MSQFQQPLEINLTNYAYLLKEEVSTEGLLERIPEFFTNKLATVVSFFNSSDSGLKTASAKELNIYFKDLHKNRGLLRTSMKNIDYAIVGRRKVPVTVGLSVDALTLARTLEESNKLVSTNLLSLLKETNNTIALLVSDKSYRLSSRPIMLDKKYRKVVKVLEDNLSSVLDPRKVSDSRDVKELAPSLPHIEEAITIALDYSGDNTTKLMETISKEVAVISNYTESLYQELKANTGSVKKTRIVEIAEYLQVSADMVTQSVNTLYLSNQSVTILNNLVKVVTK